MSRLRPREWPEDPARRTSYVDSIFRTIAPRYDLLTRLLSMGQDRRWKANVLRHVPPGDDASRHLDLATGTAALPVLFRKAWYRGTIIGLDRSRAMLREARRRGGLERVRFVEGDLDFLTLSPCANLVAVKLRAIRGAAEINLLIVTYGNNEVDRLRGRHRIPQGGETRWLDLRGGRRCVKSIAVVGDTEKSADRTILQFWGR